MGDVVFKLSAEEAQAVNAFLKVVDAQKKTEQGFDNIGRSGSMSFGQVDRAIGKIVHSGRALLGILGISGGVAGAIALVREEAARTRENLLELGKAQVKQGESAAGVARSRGPQALVSIARVAGEFKLPEETVQAEYAKLVGKTHAGPEIIEKRLRRRLLQQMGGAGWEERETAAGELVPQIQFAGIMKDLEAKGKGYMTRPVTTTAARNIATGQAMILEQQAMDVVAQKYYGAETWQKTPWWVTKGGEYGRIGEEINAVRAKQGLAPRTDSEFFGLSKGAVNAPGDQWVMSDADIRQLAQRLMEAGDKVRASSGVNVRKPAGLEVNVQFARDQAAGIE